VINGGFWRVRRVLVTGHTASLDWAIEAIVDWYDAYRDGRALRTVTLEQSKAFGR
jgi:hypothetical protein